MWPKAIADSSLSHAHRLFAVAGRKWIAVASVLLVVLFAWPIDGWAVDEEPSRIIQFDIPRQRADLALTQFAEQANLTLVFPFDIVHDKTANELVGEYRLDEAIDRLLVGTGLRPTLKNRLVLDIAVDDRSENEGKGMSIKKKAGVLAAIASLFAGGASAQEATNTNDADAALELEEVVVTGSRIRRSNANTAIPVQGLDAFEIESSGSMDLAEIVTEIPGVNYAISPENSGLSVQNPGLSSVELRGLGNNRTLTLINGRRAVSNSGNGERVSLDTVPSSFVERVEVTTGGASAIYGADAIAGVVNIILKDDFEGLEVGYRVGSADASGEEENTFELTWGSNFGQGQGNVMIGLVYDDETEVLADASRIESISPLRYVGNGEFDSTGLSSAIPGGRFEGDDAWNVGGVWFNDQSAAPNDGRDPSVGFELDLDGYNIRPGRSLSPAVERIAAATLINYDLSDATTAFAELYFTRVNVLSKNAPRFEINTRDIGAPGNTVDIGSIAADNPFIPAEVEETRSGTVSWRRRFNEVGLDIKDNERDTLRSSIGLRGDLDNGWAWEASGTYGRFEQSQIQFNALNRQNIQYALNIEDDGNGGFQCIDATARAEGCVPLNIFGEGSITDAMANYIRYTGRLNQEREQFTVAANINGDIFEMPAGMVKAAVGVEYRKEEQNTAGDPSNQTFDTSVSVVPNLAADFDVTEAFAEIDIPLLAEAPLAHSLSLQFAARVGNYSTIGSIFSYNAGGSWMPVEDFRIRGQYSRSQRAPTITEYFSPPRGDFDNIDDPCTGLLVDGTGLDPNDPNSAAFSANCLAEAGIQAFFADPNNAGLAFDGDGSVPAPNTGNNQLQEETADTFTAGIVYTPSFIPGLIVIADYYSIDIDDAVGSVSSQDTMDLCYSAADFPNNRFCNVVTRDVSGGDVTEIVNRVENLNNRKVEGIDFSIDYGFEPSFVAGQFDAKLIYNHSLTNERVFEGLNGPELTDFNGEIETPEDSYRAKFGYGLGGLRLTYTLTFYGGGVDQNDVDATDPDFFETRDEYYHDIFASYAFDNDYNLKLYGGIKNIEDETGPLIPAAGLDNSGSSSRNIVSNINRPIGREYYLGIRATF